MSTLLRRDPLGADERRRSLLVWAVNAEELTPTQRAVVHENYGLAVNDSAEFTRLFDQLIELAEIHADITRRDEAAIARYLGDSVEFFGDMDRDAALIMCVEDIDTVLSLLAPPVKARQLMAEVA